MVQFGFQVPAFIRKGYGLRPAFDFSHPGLRRILKLLLPVTFGMAVAQINIAVSNILASFLASGSITYLYYSMRLIQFPVGVFGAALGMAALSSLARHAVMRDFDSLREDFSFTLRLLFFITVPSMAGLIALREPIVNFLFQRGVFDHAATLGTAEALMYYSFGIWAFVGVRVAAATFYSMQDTRTPVKAAVAALAANVLLSLALMGPLKHSGLALANSLSSALNFTVLMVLLRRKLGRVEGRRIAASFMKVAFASAVMGLAARLLLSGGIWSRSGESLAKAGLLAVGIAASVAIYAVVCRLLRCEELAFIIERIRERRKG